MDNQKNRHFPHVDALRALAAILVVVYHVVNISQWNSFPVSGIALLFRIGWIGVDLFFVISGFVITLTAVRSYQKQGKTFIKGYARKRWNRIAPLYFFTALIYLLLVNPALIFGDTSTFLFHVLTHVFFVHNLDPVTFGSINGPNWSVALEVQFYILIALATPFLSRTSPLKILLLFVSTAVVFRYLTTLVLIPGEASPHSQHVYSAQLPGTLDGFGFGVAMAVLLISRPASKAAALLVPSWRNFLFSIVAALITCSFSWKMYWPKATYWEFPSMIVFWRISLYLAFSSILAAALTLPSNKAIIAVLSPVSYLGKISYGIYLWHIPVITTLILVPGLVQYRLLVSCLAATIIMAAASWHLFEKSFLERRPQA